MTTPIGTDAQHLNPALEPLAPLVDEWWTTGGTMSRDGGSWEDDLQLSSERMDA